MTWPETISAAVRPYRRRLALHAAAKALLAALTAGAFVHAAAELTFKIAQAEGGRMVWILAVLAALAAFAAAFFSSLPSQKETARRLDALGLRERAATMLALRDDASEIALIQRTDALERIGGVKAGQLRFRLGLLPVVLLLAALLTAALCAAVPASWFAREAEAGDGAWEEVLDMLREERDRLRESGEERLAEEFDGLIGDLERSDSVLNALGEISDAEEGVKDAAREGEASRGAMSEALAVLEEARRALLGEEEEAGEEGGEGMEEMPGMEGAEGMQGFGEEPGEGFGSEPGSQPGPQPNGPENADGTGRGSGEGEGEERPSNMTEPVYDPISGAVPYGEVFSAYYSDYLRDAESGGIPYEMGEAARTYFEDLDR